MPNTKSAKKRLRQNEACRARNRAVRSSARTSIRKVREGVQRSAVETLDDALLTATKKIDKAAGRRILHPNKAARLKSRLNKAVKQAKTGEASS